MHEQRANVRRFGEYDGYVATIRETPNFRCVVATLRAGTKLAPHSHEALFMTSLLSGACENRVGNFEATMKPGSVWIHARDERHENQIGNTDARILAIEVRPGAQEYVREGVLSIRDYLKVDHPALRNRIRALVNEIENPDRWSELSIEGGVLDLLAMSLRETGKVDPKYPAWLKQVEAILREGPPPSMDELAKIAGMHSATLCRQFRKYTGFSLGGYSRQVRLDHAVELMKDPSLSLPEIAEKAGFADHPHFCRVFRAAFGETPGRFRKGL